MPRTIPPASLLALAFVAALAAGCTTSSETVPPPAEVPAAFSENGPAEVPDRWWTAFGSARLSATVDSALARNFDLRAAFERLRAAQAVVDRQSAVLLPTLEGTASSRIVRQTDQANVGTIQGGDLSLGLASTYEVDFWGRLDARVDAEEFRAEATRADYQTATLTLAAEVARAWFRLAEARSQVALVTEQIETNRTVLQLQRNRLSVGLIQGVDVLRQQQLIEATREERARAERRARVFEHQLAVLTGQPPQDDIEAPPPAALPALPSLPETGVPIALVRRRPDVRSAFRLLQAADRDLAAAIADQYPRLTLSPGLSVGADNVSDLFQSWALSFAGNVFAPIFLGGELRAEVDRVEAVRRERLYTYGQVTLEAFQDVEDALIQEQKQRETLGHIDTQVDFAQNAYQRLRGQYLNGTIEYLEVLTALNGLQQLRRERLTARLTLVEYRIALYRALAGSVETARES